MNSIQYDRFLETKKLFKFRGFLSKASTPWEVRTKIESPALLRFQP